MYALRSFFSPDVLLLNIVKYAFLLPLFGKYQIRLYLCGTGIDQKKAPPLSVLYLSYSHPHHPPTTIYNHRRMAGSPLTCHRPSLSHLHHTPHPTNPPQTAPYGTTMASQWRPIAAHANALSARCTRRCQSESCAPLVRCARSRRARGGACRVVDVIARGRQPSAGRRAGRLSPAARAPRRGRSAPCASQSSSGL